MDDRVFLLGEIAEVPQYGVHVGIRAVEEVDNLLDAKLIKVHFRFAAARREESGKHFLKERISYRDHVREVLGHDSGSQVGRGARYGSRKESIRDCLSVHIGEVVFGEVVDEGFLKGLVELAERAALGFNGKYMVRAAANVPGEPRQTRDENVGRANGFAMKGFMRTPLP
ncbi:MAG: hypothetical protein Q8Q12_10805 [bacterium]|nr:hypothetical protein [bacterium]